VRTVKNTEEFAKEIKASASASYGGFGVSFRASMSMNSAKSFSKNSLLLIGSRIIRYGFDGWDEPPKLRKAAKDLICDKQKFIETYGTYFKIGLQKGAYMRVKYTLTGKFSK
jgi:hypothetical protein